MNVKHPRINNFARIAAAGLCIFASIIFFSCGKNDSSSQQNSTTQSATTTSATTISATETTTSITTVTPETTTSEKATTTSAVTTTAPVTTTVKATTTKAATTTAVQSAGGTLSFSTSGLKKSAQLTALTKELNDIMWSYRDKVSFSYENLQTGIKISYNGGKRYNSCSIIKAPYVKSLLQNNVNLDEKIAMKSSDVNSYSGRINNKPLGTEFTVRELIYHTIVYSNNTAYNMLYRRFSYTYFNAMTKNLGLTTTLGSTFWYRKVSSNEMAVYFKDIYNYCKSQNNKDILYQNLTHADYNQQIGYALSKYPVAQKYGSQDSTVDFHNCAVVYAPSPFVLTILTDLAPSNPDNVIIFRQIAKVIDKINTQQTSK